MTTIIGNSIQVTTFDQLEELDRQLVVEAAGVSGSAHNPFFKRWFVGAAMRIIKEGVVSVVKRANREHPTPQLSTCGERGLVEGTESDLIPFAEAIAVVGRRRRWPANRILTPCDICRPVLREFARQTGVGAGLKIILAPWDFRKGKILVLTAAGIRDLPDYDPNGIDPDTLL